MRSLCLLSAALLAGCGASSAPLHRTAAVHHLECDLAVSYTSLAQLRDAATSVALLSPIGTAAAPSRGGIPTTVATVAVRRHLTGARLPAMIRLRETGAPGVELGEGCTPLLAHGNLYLAYLVPARPGPRGQYFVAGGPEGLFADVGARTPPAPSARVFTRTGVAAAGSLPRRISIAQAAARSRR